MVELNSGIGGSHISSVCKKAVLLANEKNEYVHFEFNDISMIVSPNENPEVVQLRWSTNFDAKARAYREHPDRIKEQLECEAKEKAEREAHHVDTSASEAEMRETNVPWVKTPEQLIEYVQSLVAKQHDYGTCVYAMSMAATAAFYYVAGQLGVTGFQSGCADLDILRRTRHIEGPFMLIKGEDALYPQYDLQERLAKAMDEWKPWLKEQAETKLTESTSAHPDVVNHWKKLAE